MCCQESGEREASVSLFCPRAKPGEKKFRKVRRRTPVPFFPPPHLSPAPSRPNERAKRATRAGGSSLGRPFTRPDKRACLFMFIFPGSERRREESTRGEFVRSHGPSCPARRRSAPSQRSVARQPRPTRVSHTAMLFSCRGQSRVERGGARFEIAYKCAEGYEKASYPKCSSLPCFNSRLLAPLSPRALSKIAKLVR